MLGYKGTLLAGYKRGLGCGGSPELKYVHIAYCRLFSKDSIQCHVVYTILQYTVYQPA